MKQRTRTRGGFIPFHQGYEWHSGGSMSSNYGTYAGYGSTQTTSDVVTSDYAKRVARGDIIMNPYDTQLFVRTGKPVAYRLNHTSGQFWYNDGNCTYSVLNSLAIPGINLSATSIPSPFTSQEEDALITEASTACLANVGAPSINNWENLFQLRQSIDELRHPLRNFSLWSDNFVSKTRYYARTGKRVKAPRGAQVKDGVRINTLTPSNLWLQYRYGLRLLIEDVLATLNSIGKDRLTKRLTTRAKRTKPFNSSRGGASMAGVGRWEWTVESSAQMQVRAMSIDDIEIDWLYNLGLTGGQLLTVPWELIPYSFVVDWFVNVGEFINATTNGFRWKTAGRCYSLEVISQQTIICTPNGGVSGYTLSGSSGLMTLTSKVKRRRVGLSNPSLLLKSDFRFSELTRAADAVSLALGAFDRAWGSKGLLRNLVVRPNH